MPGKRSVSADSLHRHSHTKLATTPAKSRAHHSFVRKARDLGLGSHKIVKDMLQRSLLVCLLSKQSQVIFFLLFDETVPRQNMALGVSKHEQCKRHAHMGWQLRRCNGSKGCPRWRCRHGVCPEEVGNEMRLLGPQALTLPQEVSLRVSRSTPNTFD